MSRISPAAAAGGSEKPGAGFLPALLSALVLAVWAAAVPAAPARAETFEATHRYVMGDRDTRHQARQICFAQAKRRLMEKIGTLVVTESRTGNLRLTADQVRSFSAGIVSITESGEKMELEAGSPVLVCTVTAEVDPEKLRAELMQLARELPPAGELPAASGPGGPGPTGPAQDPHAAAERMKKDRDAAEAAARMAEPGMSLTGLQTLAGAPSTVIRGKDGFECHNYGRTWVVLRDGVVVCIRRKLQDIPSLGGRCHCSGLSTTIIRQ